MLFEQRVRNCARDGAMSTGYTSIQFEFSPARVISRSLRSDCRPADSDLLKFIEAAPTQGASDVVLVGLLKGRGWPEDDIYRALGKHYEKLTGLPIPIHRAASAQAPSPYAPRPQAVNSQPSKTAAQALSRATGAPERRRTLSSICWRSRRWGRGPLESVH